MLFSNYHVYVKYMRYIMFEGKKRNFVLKENFSLKDLPYKDMFTEDLKINMSDITIWQNPHQHFPFPCSLQLNLSFLSTLHPAFSYYWVLLRFFSLAYSQRHNYTFFSILTLSNIIKNYLRNKLTLWMWNVSFFFSTTYYTLLLV